MTTHSWKRYCLLLTAGGGAALLMAAGAHAAAAGAPDDGAKAVSATTQVALAGPERRVLPHPVPPVVAPPNCADGFSQTAVSGQPGGAPFEFSCKAQVTCPPGTEYIQSIVQVSGTQTGATTATFTYGCSYLSQAK